MDASNLFQMLVNPNATCAKCGMTDEERLELFELAWLTTAGNLRSAALAIPDGFPTERARQLGLLEKMAAIVAGDEPDLEAERLMQDQDVEGLLRHYRAKLADGGTSS